LFLYERAGAMDRAQSVAFILLCVFALSLPGCVTGPGFGKAEPGQPQVRRPAATETKPAKKAQPPEEKAQPPEEKAQSSEEKAQSPEKTEAPPKPMKPPSIGGSGG